MNEVFRKCKWVLGLLLLSACVHRFEMSPVAADSIERAINQKQFWLKQSLYAGPFYDDDRYQLLHPSPFDELTFLTTPDGDIIYPPKEKFVVPVGTQVTIEQIEWPTFVNVVNRPLLTPRGLPWLKMTVAMERGNVSLLYDGVFIMLVPLEKGDEKAFHKWFDAMFSSEDSNRWLLRLTKAEQEAIESKKPVLGMSGEALTAALGSPLSLSSRTVKKGDSKVTVETATYGKYLINLSEGKVSEIQVRVPKKGA
jgi:hypothetical protein